ncbi:MAG: LPS export ABC transporter permease LptF [Burkholderiaceae bacterium]
MLFNKALKRELRSIAGIVFATLFTIMVTTSLVRFLGRAASGRVDSASVLPLIAFSSINILGPLLVLTLFVAVLMTLTRAWRDSEMVIWQTAGLSMTAWIRPVLSFAAPFVVLAGMISFLLAPWANQQIFEYQQRFAEREDVSMVAAGQFRESSRADRVFFVESLNDEQTEVRNVFVTQQRDDRLIVVVSRRGQVQNMDGGQRYLVLEKGRRYDGRLGDAEMRMMEFERYGLRIDPKPVSKERTRSKSKLTRELLFSGDQADLGELVRRIGVPLSAILLALLAIPLSAANPRMGRSINLVVALLLYMIYANLLSLSQAWVGQGKMPFWLGVWAIHAAALAVIVSMFWRRMSLTRLLPKMPAWRNRSVANEVGQ